MRTFFNPIWADASIFPFRPPIGLMTPPELMIPVIETFSLIFEFFNAATVNTAIAELADGPPTIAVFDLMV